jgi:flagellar protein FlaG
MDITSTQKFTDIVPSTQSGELAPRKPGETTLTVDAVERPPRAEPTKTDKQLEELMKVIDRAQARAEHHVGISLDEKTNEPIIRITEKDSGRLVREIPPEETRRLSEKLSQIRGLLIDKDG